jgi:hypothetical protein
MIVLGYDGSEEACTAIGHAAGLLGSQEVTVLTGWEPA